MKIKNLRNISNLETTADSTMVRDASEMVLGNIVKSTKNGNNFSNYMEIKVYTGYHITSSGIRSSYIAPIYIEMENYSSQIKQI